MWLALVASILLGLFGAVEFRILPPPWAPLILRIRKGSVSLIKGRLSLPVRDQLAEILAEEGVAAGFVAMTKRGRFLFSRTVPPSVCQRLRNVLVNCRPD